MDKLIIFTCLFFIFGCSSNSNTTSMLKEPKISSQGAYETIIQTDSLQDFPKHFFREIESIPLETTQNSLIGYIDKIIITDSAIVIGDYHKTKQIFIFNARGKFIRTISNIGHANNEYISLFDISLSSCGNNLFILDGDNNKLLEFSLNGDFIKTTYLPVKYSSNFIIENDSICWLERCFRLAGDTKPIEHNLLRYNYKTNLITNEFFPFNSSQYFYKSFRQCFSINSKQQVHYWEQLSNQVYELGIDSLNLKYNISGDILPYPDEMKTLKPKEFIKESRVNLYGYVNTFLSLPNWDIISYNTTNSNIQVWINKTTKKEYILRNKISLNNNDVFVPADIYESSDSSLCSWLSALAFCNYYPTNTFNLNINSNPVIIKYKLHDLL